MFLRAKKYTSEDPDENLYYMLLTVVLYTLPSSFAR